MNTLKTKTTNNLMIIGALLFIIGVAVGYAVGDVLLAVVVGWIGLGSYSSNWVGRWQDSAIWVPIAATIVLVILLSAGLSVLVSGFLLGTAVAAIGGGLVGFTERRKEILAY